MATTEQLEAIRAYVAKKLEIAIDECAELLGVSMDQAQAILDGMPEWEAHYKAYRGRKDYPNVYSLPWPPDPRDRGDGSRDMGHVLPQNQHLAGGAFRGVLPTDKEA